MSDKSQKPENGLYIGDLEEGITEEQLFVEFRKHGAIQFVKLHRFPFIGKSKHFGFVYFSSKEEAEKAREAMNYKELLRHPMRITKIADYEKEANLFFAGFSNQVTLKEVDQFFSQWGSVFSVKFSLDENKKSRGYGWVQFEKKEQAEAVLEKCVDGKLKYGDSEILMKPFVKKGTPTEREDRRNNLYVKNFWPALDTYDLENEEVRKELIAEMETKLKEWFAEYGTVISVFVRIDVERKAPFAFISFNLHQEARRAQQELGLNAKRDLGATGRPVYVGWAQTKTDRKQQRDTNYNAKYIYCDHIARNVTEEQIRTTLREAGFGEIQLVRLEKMQQGFQQIIRIGYLIFEQASDANKLIKQYKECQNADKIRQLFDLPPQDTTRPLFQYLYPQHTKNNNRRGGNQRFVSPSRRIPMNFPMPQMGQVPMGPIGPIGPIYMHGAPMMGMGISGPRTQMPFQGYQQNYRQNNKAAYQRPMVGNQQTKTEYVAVPYDKKQDLLELLEKMEDFLKQDEQEQRQKLFLMLFRRMKLKHSDKSEEFCKKIVEVLVDKDNFTVEEIMNMLKDESTFEESVKDTIEAFEEEENQ